MDEANKRMETLPDLPEEQKEKYKLHVEESEQVGGVIDRVATQVENVLENKYVKKGIYKVLDTVDENYMDTIRKIWDKTPGEVKWAIIEQGHISRGLPFVVTIQILVKSGLLEYDEQSVQDMAATEKKVMEWGAKYGPIIQPELLFLRPLVEPIKRVLEIQDKAFLEMRAHLKAKRGVKALPKGDSPLGENTKPQLPKNNPASGSGDKSGSDNTSVSDDNFEPSRWSV